MSRLADHVEEMQLSMAAELQEQALQMLDDKHVEAERLRLVVGELSGALQDVVRVATSRGHRMLHPTQT
ncbi:hypothetical protein [Streptomyces sp. JW3]|uniref:hypothetical protein n=1 Tax=Streptomyces sp. JW3 TaxID=3456955 RepID=UPI003FA47437